MGIFNLIVAFTNIILQLLELAQKYMLKKRKTEYVDDVEAIKNNAVDYANNRYGGVPSDAPTHTDNARPLRSGDADKP